MEQNYSLLTILLAILIASFVTSFFGGIPTLIFDLSNLSLYGYYPIFVVVSVIISPFLIFIGFYQIGKKFNLKLNLKPTIIRLLLGSYFGHFLANNLIYLMAAWEYYPLMLLGSIISTAFLQTFFISVSALAIAYLRSNIEETDEVKEWGSFEPSPDDTLN